MESETAVYNLIDNTRQNLGVLVRSLSTVTDRPIRMLQGIHVHPVSPQISFFFFNFFK